MVPLVGLLLLPAELPPPPHPASANAVHAVAISALLCHQTLAGACGVDCSCLESISTPAHAGRLVVSGRAARSGNGRG
ncbi:MAG TPA: hypothetical protein VK195_08625, partial [Burkholderiaceae bacterium]|nr:hypothetical protein [Burkholderiaceae bacterium]